MRNPFRGSITIIDLCPTQTFLCVVSGTLLAILAAIGLLFFLASPAHAGNKDLIRDRNGPVLSKTEGGPITVRRGYGERLNLYNGRGSRIGTITKGYGDRRLVINNRGRRVATIEEFDDDE